MREELDRASEALSWALGVAVQVCVLPVVAAARVVLARLGLAVCLCLDVLVQLVVLGELPEQALLPFVCSCQPKARETSARCAHLRAACRQSRATACRPASCASRCAWGRLFLSDGSSRIGPGRWATGRAVPAWAHSSPPSPFG